MLEDKLNLPVYVSTGRPRNSTQEASTQLIGEFLQKNNLEWRSLGITDFTTKSPFQFVLELIKECYGGIILGFERFRSSSSDLLEGTTSTRETASQVTASPWHQIETTALFTLNLPLLIFKESEVQGGIFDREASDFVIYDMPRPNQAMDKMGKVFSIWAAKVREHYESVNSIFDVFLSFSGEDETQAREVFEFLASKGLRVFFSRESIPRMGQAEYMKAINEGLDNARHMIIVSNSAKGFGKPWVEREWTMFLNEKLSGRKSGNIVVVQATSIPVAKLPIALRSQQVVVLSKQGLEEVLKFVSPIREGH
jgi:hypothetical protein